MKLLSLVTCFLLLATAVQAQQAQSIAPTSTTVAGVTCTLGSTCGLNTLTNSIGADVSLNNSGAYFDGPSAAQGTTGTWCANGTVTLSSTTSGDAFFVKLWDGTTVISSGGGTWITGMFASTVTLSGCLASPAANIRISVEDPNSANGKIRFNSTGLSKDSTITVWRVN